MSISIVDAFIILFIILGAIVGFKQGAIKTGTRFIGLFVIIIISFLLKDKLMVLMYENLPFFNFFGIIEGIEAVNVLLYQLLSFILIFLALMFILKVLLVVTGLVEHLLKMTIFLSIPSKILGLFLGAIEYYVYVFIVLYIINMPVFNLDFVNESNFGNSILENTPILSEIVDDTVNVYSDVWDTIKNREGKTNSEVNSLVLATLLDNKLISIESARKLVSANRIHLDDPSILDNYDENDNFYQELEELYNEKYNK